MTKIIGIRRLEGTTQRSGVGDNWHTTWANNDKQYTALDDGTGWPEIAGYTDRLCTTRVFAIHGDASNHTFEHLPRYPDLHRRGYPNTRQYIIVDSNDNSVATFYGFGILALDGYIYHFLSTPNQSFSEPDPTFSLRFVGAKLIYSPDNGESWKNQDGSPFRWEGWDERNRENMAFFYEPGNTFSLLTMLQMGKNYEHNTDGYVYAYAPNGNEKETMNQLVMFRVPKDKILSRSAYEYFVSRNPDGTANWSAEIRARGVVHTFPSGWVNKIYHPYAWQPSVVYNAPLGVYMMANWGMGSDSDGMWFAKPSYLGFWIAAHPWGPWNQVYEENAWMPEGDSGARAYQPQIIPKWIGKDGKSFWLVFTDFQAVPGTTPLERPYYCFNYQKVEILTE